MTRDQIIQISNDISEGMLSPRVTKAQLLEVILYFRGEFDREIQRKNEEVHRLKLEVYNLQWNWARIEGRLKQFQKANPKP